MVSRDTQVQAGAVAIGVALLLGWSLVDGGSNAGESGVPIAETMFSLGVTFVVLAGSHLYLASRGEAGIVPVDARWRFVAVVATTLVLSLAAILLTEVEPVAGVEPHLPVLGVLAAVLAGYFVYEAREGYLERKPA